MGPEFLDPESFGFVDDQPTKGSDCYALGMVIFEVLSGQVPFARDKNWTVALKVIRGERPERPEGAWFTDDLWKTLGQCWSPLPKNRPTVETVLDCLGRIFAWQPLPDSDGMTLIGVDNELHSTVNHPCTFLHFTSDLALKRPSSNANDPSG